MPSTVRPKLASLGQGWLGLSDIGQLRLYQD